MKRARDTHSEKRESDKQKTPKKKKREGDKEREKKSER